VSGYLQEKLLHLGSELSYDRASETASLLLGVPCNAKKIERICTHHGTALEEVLEQEWEQESDLPQSNELTYCMVDGSMIHSREQSQKGRDDWKETKLARIFSSSSRTKLSKNRGYITSNQYVAHLGDHHNFFRKLAPIVARIPNQVWIADGARWIWDWVETHHPEATQILDFYHVAEKLHEICHSSLLDQNQQTQWVEAAKQKLLDDQVDAVILDLKSLPIKGPEKSQRDRLVNFFSIHRKRMLYGLFIKRGLLIGSGPIEAAHRSIIQKRLKLTGQRWTTNGAQAVLNIRTAAFSGKWETVQKLIRFAA